MTTSGAYPEVTTRNPTTRSCNTPHHGSGNTSISPVTIQAQSPQSCLGTHFSVFNFNPPVLTSDADGQDIPRLAVEEMLPPPESYAQDSPLNPASVTQWHNI